MNTTWRGMKTLLEAGPDDSNDEDWNDPDNDWNQEILKTISLCELEASWIGLPMPT